MSFTLVNDKILRCIFESFRLDNPSPAIELNYTTSYTLLIAVVLSAQATDISVNKATKELFAKADNPKDMLALGEQNLIGYIRRVGLFRSKARYIISLSHILLRDYSGNIPADRDSLEKLPGVGRKTASVLMNVIYGKPFIAVDTHVFRLSRRLGLALAKTPSEVGAILEKRIPPEFRLHAHYWLVLHGRHVCRSRKPLCASCLVAKWCNSPEKVRQP